MGRRQDDGMVTGGVPADPAETASWAERVESWRQQLLQAGTDRLGDEDRLALLRQLELLTRTAAGVGADLQVAFYSSQVAAQVADGVAPSRAGKAVPDDLAQTRLTSPYWGSRELTSAKALVKEMPQTLSALRAGVITAAQARVITEATTCVEAADRAEIDQRLAPRLAGSSTQEIGALARSLVYEVDPAGFVARARKAAADRGVSVRPCPDVMGLLSARLPAPQAIACYSALRSTAEAMKASGDPRTLAQLMADALFERLTGRTVVDGVDVEVGLVITDEALFAGTSDPAVLLGYGPIPAQSARDLLNPTTDTGATEPGRAGARDATGPTTTPTTRPTITTATATGKHDQARGDDPQAEGDSAQAVDSTAQVETDTAEAVGDTVQADGDAVQAAGDTDHADPVGKAAGFCPDGPRCTSFSCTLTHGHPAAGLPAPPDLGALSRPDPPPSPVPGESSARTTSPVPPDVVEAAVVWVRRLYTDPVTGVLTERDGRKRLFTGALRAFLVSRDQTCRNTWCGAPVRHIDHVQRHADQGRTEADNGQGLCARCNLARERPRQLDTPAFVYRPPPPLLPCLPRPRDSQAA